ncbi:MAG: hypothetical protein ACRDTQ_02095 [Micromonosporaceae bacterium]
MYDEGLATVLSRALVPGHEADEYLWFGPGWSQWLRDCEASWDEIRDRLRTTMLTDDQSLFRARPGSAGGLPLRSGYYAGMRALDWVCRETGTSMDSVFSNSAAEAIHLMKAFLAAES